jgi:hypothetical protein
MTKSEFEARAKSLIGKKIRQVTYDEIDYGDNRYHFFDDSRFDSIDLGIDLIFSDDSRIRIAWGDEFYPYGISLLSGSPDTTIRMLDVTHNSRWEDVIGKEIINSQVSWSWSVTISSSEQKIDRPGIRHDYPQDLLIEFEHGGRIIISALEVRGDTPMGMMDNLTVFDDVELAKRFKCLQG